MKQLEHFNPQKRPKRPQKRGYYIAFEAIFAPKTPNFNPKNAQKTVDFIHFSTVFNEKMQVFTVVTFQFCSTLKHGHNANHSLVINGHTDSYTCGFQLFWAHLGKFTFKKPEQQP